MKITVIICTTCSISPHVLLIMKKEDFIFFRLKMRYILPPVLGNNPYRSIALDNLGHYQISETTIFELDENE